MDEENQEQQEGQKQSAVGEFAKQQASQAAKQVADQVKQQAKQELKKKAAELWAKVAAKIAAVAWPVILGLLVIITLIIVLGAVEDYIDKMNAQTIDEVTYQTIEEYCTIDETGIHLDKEKFLRNIVINLQQNGIDLNDLGLGSDGDYSIANNTLITGNDILPYSQAAEYLYKYISAALAGEFPYIEGSDEETQGIVKIKRKKWDTKAEKEEEVDLTYMGYEQFQEMLKTTDNLEKDKMLNYFSLDDSWNLCIVKPYKYTLNGVMEYTISEVKIPYRSMVSQYTVPFLFLIDLQLVTQNANYVSAVAELMTDQSFVDFTIFDSITTNTYQYEYMATRHAWRPKEVQASGQTVIGVSRTEWEPYTSGVHDKTEIISEVDNIKANITKVKTWIIEQETNYEMQINKEYAYGPNGTTTTLPDESDPGNHGSYDTDRSEYKYEEIIKREWMKSGDTKTVITPSEFMGLWANETGTYVKGAPYRAVGDGKVGKLVAYPRLNGTLQTTTPIDNIVTARDELYEYLEDSKTTQTHAELMREMVRVYMESEELTEGTFYTSAFTSMYEPFEFVEGSYVGNFDVHDESLFITDLETLKKALAGGYSKSEKLVANAQAFLDMQKNYKVNAIFAAAVSITETGAGRDGNAINGCRNWFNITGTDGPYITVTNKYGETYHWRKYETDYDGIDAFGKFISGKGNTQRYYPQGNYTVADIGKIYCPNTSVHPTQADDWIESTLAQMSRFYEAVGIDISPIINTPSGEGFGYEVSGEALSDPQFAAMYAEASKHLGLAYVWGGSSPETGFDCSGFVSWVINQSGVGNVGRSTANGLRKHCAYVSKEQAKPGDLIFFQGTYQTAGASHVGIYIGDGKMIHCGDPISVTSIETSYWQSHFLDFGRIQ